MPKYRLQEKPYMEYDSIVKVRKAAVEYGKKNHSRVVFIQQYSQRHANRWYQIGEVEFGPKSIIYYQNIMSMPRPNNIKEGEWVIGTDGRIKSTVSANIRTKSRTENRSKPITKEKRPKTEKIAEVLWGIYATLKKSYDYYPKKGWYNKYGTFVPEEGFAVGYRTKKEAIETMNILSKTNPEYQYEVKEIKKHIY